MHLARNWAIVKTKFATHCGTLRRPINGMWEIHLTAREHVKFNNATNTYDADGPRCLTATSFGNNDVQVIVTLGASTREGKWPP
jgi:hypothetical protein